MGLYTTIPPSCVPAEAFGYASDERVRQAKLLGLPRDPILVWFDDAERVGRFAEVWEPETFEDVPLLRGFYEPWRTLSPSHRQRIFVKARGSLADILATIGHECRHAYQHVYGHPSEWIGGRWVDTSTKSGSEADAYAYGQAISVPGWAEHFEVVPNYC